MLTSMTNYNQKVNLTQTEDCLPNLTYTEVLIQTILAFFYVSSMVIVPFAYPLFWLNPFLWPLLLEYQEYLKTDRTHIQGGCRNKWLRSLPIWNYLANYFPTRLIKEETLDPSKNYIFGYHPHGILFTGAFINFCTEATGVSKIFPGLNIRFLTIDFVFKLPLYRDYVLGLGQTSASKESMMNILNSGPGNSCVLCVGGSDEALLAKPDKLDLIVNKRFGFISLAIKSGASLVPVFAFGENMLFDQVDAEPGSYLHNFHMWVKNLTGFVFPVFYGCGLISESFGLLPRRRPLNVVVGKAIHLEKDEDPSKEKVQLVHQQYLTALQDLYDRNKDKYSPGVKNPAMRFI